MTATQGLGNSRRCRSAGLWRVRPPDGCSENKLLAHLAHAPDASPSLPSCVCGAKKESVETEEVWRARKLKDVCAPISNKGRGCSRAKMPKV
jgi:hypothetical protein